jgi:PAS domain S-box-containing protein
MSKAVASRSRHGLSLVIALSAVTLAALVLRRASPSDVGVRAATAAALVIVLVALLAVWLDSMRNAATSSAAPEPDLARNLLAAIPDGLLLVEAGGVRSVNAALCSLVGFDAEDLLGARAPLPFWPPEHAHEIARWHEELAERGEHRAELTFRHKDGRRLRVLVSGRAMSRRGDSHHLVTIHDVSAGYERERRLQALATRDVQTGLLDRGEFERRLGDAVRRAMSNETNVAVVLAELTLAGRPDDPVFESPEAAHMIGRLRALLRAGDELARTGTRELGMILPDTDAHGGVGAVARARAELAELGDVALTVGVCDLEAAGDALALYAFADRALAQACRHGVGGTVQFSTAFELAS